jgi:hypothetical protein
LEPHGRSHVTSREHAGSAVPTYKEYQERAAECLRLAQSTNDPTNKALLLEMAQTWVRLAEQAQREERGKK